MTNEKILIRIDSIERSQTCLIPVIRSVAALLPQLGWL